MDLSFLRDQLGDYADDVRINLDNFYDETLGISETDIIACALACAYASKSLPLIDFFTEMAEKNCTDAQIEGAKSAAVIMAQNNVYYRTMGLLKDEEYFKLSAGLKMNVVQKPPVEKDIFEYFCMAVSAVNSCKGCLNAHHQGLMKLGWNHQQIQSGIRIASIIVACAQALMIG